jgi:hypothetical protein
MNISPSVCQHCGVTSTEQRDYMPITYIVELRADINATYVLTPEVEHFLNSLAFKKIRSIDASKRIYAFDTPLQGREATTLWKLLDSDSRIKSWNTLVIRHPDDIHPEAALVCPHHTHFVKATA